MWSTGQYDQGIYNTLQSLLSRLQGIEEKLDSFFSALQTYWFPVLATICAVLVAIMILKWVMKI